MESFMNSFEEFLKGTLTFFRMYYLSTEGMKVFSRIEPAYLIVPQKNLRIFTCFDYIYLPC